MTETTEAPGGTSPGEPAAPPPVPPTPALRPIDIVRRNSRATKRCLVIPEWEGLEIWFGQLTVADLEYVGTKDVSTDLERNLWLVITKAEDSKGVPVFAQGDLHFLRTEAPLQIVQRIIDFMFAAAANLPTVDEEADRIAQDPPSGSA